MNQPLLTLVPSLRAARQADLLGELDRLDAHRAAAPVVAPVDGTAALALAPAVPLQPAPAAAPRPVLRVVPAPPCAPPFDDERGRTPLLRLVASPPAPVEQDDSAWCTEDRTPAADLPDPRRFAGQLLQALVETAAGARPLSQLRLQLSLDLYAALARSRAGGRVVAGGRPEPRSVGRVHVQVRAEGVVEACALVRCNRRLRAVALRLEGFNGRWVCTELEGL